MGDRRLGISQEHHNHQPQPHYRKTQKEIEKEEEEIFKTLPSDFGREDFNPSKYVLENLPDQVDIALLDQVLEEKEKVLDVVNNKLSALIMSSYSSFVQGMSQIHELGLDLQQSALMCKTSKSHLLGIQEGMTKGSLIVVSKYNKRQVLNNLVDMMGKIKNLLGDEMLLKRLISEGDYPAAIQKCLECQTTLGTLIQYKALQGMGSTFGEHYRLIQDRLDASLQQMCSTFPFSPISFQRVFSAYRLLGKADRMVERLTPFFVDTVEVHAAKIVKTHVLLAEHNAMRPEVFKQMPLRELTQHVDEENYLDCLRSVCEYLCDLIAAHTSMRSWLSSKTEADLLENGKDTTTVTHDKEKDFVRELLSCLARVTRSSWENMQRLLALVLFGFKASFKVEEFLQTLYCLHKMLSIGEEFAKIKGEVLRQAIVKQSKIYFEHFHAARIEDLRTMLEHEMWHKCPLQPDFTVFDIKEFRQAVSRDTSDIGNTFSQATFNIPEGNLEKLITDGNPFAKQNTSEANGAAQAPWWSFEGENATVAADMQLRAEALRKRFAKENGPDTQLTLTSTTINVVRFMGKYLLMMKLLPLSTVVWNGLVHLYEYYVYSCIVFFSPPGTALDEHVSYEVRSMLLHLQRTHGTQPAPTSPMNPLNPLAHKDRNDHDDHKLKLPTRSPMVSEGMSDPKQLWGLSYRVVAIESLLFLVDALRSAMPLVQTTLPTDKLDQMNQFFSDTLAIVPELRLQWYKAIAKTLINFDAIITAISNVKWEIKEIGLEHSPYVDLILQNFKEVAKGTEAIEIPPIAKRTIWESLITNAMEALVEGYSRAKRCNNEGRAIMSLDLKVLLHSLENIIPASVAPLNSSARISPSNFTFVDNYVKAFYQPHNELIVFAKNHPEYTTKQISAILTSNVNSNLKKKQRQDLLNALEDMEKTRKKDAH